MRYFVSLAVYISKRECRAARKEGVDVIVEEVKYEKMPKVFIGWVKFQIICEIE